MLKDLSNVPLAAARRDAPRGAQGAIRVDPALAPGEPTLGEFLLQKETHISDARQALQEGRLTLGSGDDSF